ncbi:hypothetical protein E2562_009517, partial [Oryza meyeriana var. granulata]
CLEPKAEAEVQGSGWPSPPRRFVSANPVIVAASLVAHPSAGQRLRILCRPSRRPPPAGQCLRLLSRHSPISAESSHQGVVIPTDVLHKELQLDSCDLVTSISLDSPCLEIISLSRLSKCTDLNLQSPMLSQIEVSRCSALEHISITSGVLERLVLLKQEALIDLSLKCKSLVDVDLTGCKSLTTAISEVYNDGGGCPMLRTLVLDNCEVSVLITFSL